MADFETGVDPFTRVHRGLMMLLRSHEVLRSRILAANWIDYAGDDEAPNKTAASDSDFPQLEVAPVGGSFDLWGTSTSMLGTPVWRAVIRTGSMRVHKHLYPLTFALLQALSRSASDLGMPETVKLAELRSVEQFVAGRGDDGQGTTQWVVRATIAVELAVPKTSLHERGSTWP